MKFFFIFFPCLLLNISSFSQNNSGPHGGVIKKADKYFIEVNNNESNFYSWLFDESKRPVITENISCDVLFFFPDSTSQDLKAKPFGADGFIVENINVFASCRVSYTIIGNTISATFESISPIVKQQ